MKRNSKKKNYENWSSRFLAILINRLQFHIKYISRRAQSVAQARQVQPLRRANHAPQKNS